MSLPFKIIVASAYLLVTALGLQAQSVPPTGHKPILPIAPADILPLMPPTPDTWELKQSRATNAFTQWLSTEGFREYTHPALPPSGAAPGSSATPAPPMILRIRIMDTGYNPILSGDFEQFAPEKSAAGEKLMLNGFQATMVPLGQGAERLRISIKRRFIVQIDTLNQPPGAAIKWVKAVNLAQLVQVPDSGADQLPRPIPMKTIDELYPQKSSSTKMQWMSDEEVEAATKKTKSR